ncbi:MAG: FAD-dependent oxidoreductase, partial [Firmicutes bacterium]|nr:FAD-dependent oxidoreductase [Bacillota bacterium]
MTKFDVIIVGAGPGGVFASHEFAKKSRNLRIACFEQGNELSKRHCPIDGEKIKTCIHCKTCSIMSGFGGAGAFSDGKYNITNEFGGSLYEYIGRQKAIRLMKYVDEINMEHGGAGTRLFSTANSNLKKKCFEHDLKLLEAQVRHLGTDKNYV